MHRKLMTLFLTICLLFTCAYTVLAEEFDPDRTGSIAVTLVEPKEHAPIVGAELSVYHVATAVMDADGKLTYDYTSAFRQLDTALDDPALATKLDNFVAANVVSFAKMTTNAQGAAMCDALPLGLYFVKQTGLVEGFAPCTSFLVTIPNEKDGEYVYEVNASPKTDVARSTDITIKKVWNTDKSTQAAQSVTIQLLRNDIVVKTAILNAQNNWQVTYTDMPESDGYRVKEVGVPKGFTATYKQNGYVFTVTNTSTLAQTGQLTWPIPVLAAAGMLFIAVGISFLQKKRTTNA